MQNLSGKRIFYVEDDVRNRVIVQTILERAGASLFFERWGQDETLHRLSSAMPVDLILLDLMFPNKLTGYDIFDLIRQQQQFAHIPIVALSAANPSVEVPKTRQKGFAGFIRIPINMWTFPEIIEACIRGEQVWAEV